VQGRSSQPEDRCEQCGRACPHCPKKDRRIAELQRKNEELRKQLAEAQQAEKRQAAPFSKGDPKKKPKKPGRKPGERYGKRGFRPTPQYVDETIDVPVTECSCPHCGGELVGDTIHNQFETDIPPVKPRVRKYCVHRKRCKKCGRWVQGRHSEQTSDALGAASNLIGPNAISLGIQLNKTTGASYGKVSRFLEDFFGLIVHRSTILRALLRAAEKAEPLYGEIKIIVRHSRVIYPDETGWKVGGLKRWLWAFVSLTEKATLYMIEPSRGFDVIAAALGADFAGLLGRDGWAPYDSLEQAIHGMCNGHLIRRASLLEENARGGAVIFPREIKALLQSGLDLRDLRDEGRLSRRQFLSRASKLEWRLDELITKNFSDDENRKLAGHLIDHRESIFSYLYHPELEATNWPAEQAIRPAVVNRKMSGGGNRTDVGARAQAILTTVLRTAWQRSLDVHKLLVELLRSRDSQKYAAMALGP
jgi:transposase